MMAARSAGRAWMAVSEVIAYRPSQQLASFPFRGRRRRTIWMAWAACGKASPAATAVIFMVRRSAPRSP